MNPPVAIVDIGTKHHLTGRAAVIVALVCAYAEEINRMHAGVIHLHCGNAGEVKPPVIEDWLGKKVE